MPRKPRRPRRAVFLETLEDRRLLAVLDALDGLSPTAADGASAAVSYDETSVLVRFRETETHSGCHASIDVIPGAELSSPIQLVPCLYQVHLPKNVSVDAALKAFRSSQDVVYAQPNHSLVPAPKRSVQSLLAQYELGPNVLVLIDTGIYDQGGVIITADDEGAAYAGSPGGSVFSAGASRRELVDADFNLIYGLTFDGPQSGIGILARNGSTNNDFFRNRFNTPATNICSICWGHTARVCFLQFAPDGIHRTELFSAGDTPQGSEVFVRSTSADYSRRHQ